MSNNGNDIGLDPKPSVVNTESCTDFSGFGSDQF